MRTGISGVAAEGAVSAKVAAKIGQRQKNLARVGDRPGFETFFGGTRVSKLQRDAQIRRVMEQTEAAKELQS